MAHLVESFAYNGEAPWHGIGVEVSNDLSVKEMQKAAGADFEVRKLPEYVKVEVDGKIEEILTGNEGLYRFNKDGTFRYFDSVSSDWNETQNDVAFEFWHEWVAAGKMEMHTAGVLDEGKKVFCLAKVNQGFSLFRGKDRIDSYMLFSNPHEYGKAITIMSTPIRVVCNNTLQLALSKGKDDMTVRVDHRKPFDPELVKEMLQLNTMRLDTYKEVAQFISNKKAKKPEVLEFFSRIWPLGPVKDGDGKRRPTKDDVEGEFTHVSRNAQRAYQMIDAQPGAELGAGTWWQAFNQVTYMVDHEIGQNPNSRMNQAFYGKGRQWKNQALKLAAEYAKGGASVAA